MPNCAVFTDKQHNAGDEMERERGGLRGGVRRFERSCVSAGVDEGAGGGAEQPQRQKQPAGARAADPGRLEERPRAARREAGRGGVARQHREVVQPR